MAKFQSQIWDHKYVIGDNIDQPSLRGIHESECYFCKLQWALFINHLTTRESYQDLYREISKH